MERFFGHLLAFVAVTTAPPYTWARDRCVPIDVVTPSPHERALTWLQIAGFVAVSSAHVYWLGLPNIDLTMADDGFAVLLSGAVRTVLTVGLCVVIGILLLAVLGGRHRRALFDESRAPLRALMTLIGVGVGFWIMVILQPSTMVSFGDSFIGLVGRGLFLLLNLAAFLALLGAGFALLVHGARHRLRINEGPRVLVPVSIGLTAIIALVESTVRTSYDGFLVAYPIWAAVLCAFIGPIVAIGISIHNLAFLKRTGGILAPRSTGPLSSEVPPR